MTISSLANFVEKLPYSYERQLKLKNEKELSKNQ